MACPGSVAACAHLPDTTSTFAAEGTAMHTVAERCLLDGSTAFAHMGLGVPVGDQVVTVNQEMCIAIDDYLAYVRDVVQATGGEMLVEQRLSIEHLTGEPGAEGTADVVILAGDELIVIDLKGGRGVAVEADNNPQLQIYALAAMEQFGLALEFKTVRMVIVQPRLGSVSEWTQTTAEMADFAEQVRGAAEITRRPDAPLIPTDKGCKFCKGKATCPALAEEVLDYFEAVKPSPLTEPDRIAMAMAKADLIESWVKAIRAEVESRLIAGQPVPGFKLVQGKRGNRKWTDERAAEELLKGMRIKHDLMYDYSVISPTTAEKLAKSEEIGPRQWPKVAALITQSEGKPSVAPDSDKRPALVMSAVADDFQDMTATTSNLA
jgi:hypothetical protein